MQSSSTTKDYLIDYDKTQAFVVYDTETQVRQVGDLGFPVALALDVMWGLTL